MTARSLTFRRFLMTTTSLHTLNVVLGPVTAEDLQRALIVSGRMLGAITMKPARK